jgi:hypothetical protein
MKKNYYHTGFKLIDDRGGFQKGDLVVIGGATSMDKATQTQEADKQLMSLRNSICRAIESNVINISILDGEYYQTNVIRRMIETRDVMYGLACGMNRRATLCNIYADYCSNAFPFVQGKKRRDLFLKLINNHFYGTDNRHN